MNGVNICVYTYYLKNKENIPENTIVVKNDNDMYIYRNGNLDKLYTIDNNDETENLNYLYIKIPEQNLIITDVMNRCSSMIYDTLYTYDEFLDDDVDLDRLGNSIKELLKGYLSLYMSIVYIGNNSKYEDFLNVEEFNYIIDNIEVSVVKYSDIYKENKSLNNWYIPLFVDGKVILR